MLITKILTKVFLYFNCRQYLVLEEHVAYCHYLINNIKQHGMHVLLGNVESFCVY